MAKERNGRADIERTETITSNGRNLEV